jgi:hypothetical protein
MLEWILTSVGIAAFSVASVELFGPTDVRCDTGNRQSAPSWATMTDAELDELVRESSVTENEDERPDLRLAA